VDPFYLEMMRENARGNGIRLMPALLEAGRTTTTTEVIALLSDHWRTRVMGAWFAVMHDDQDVTYAVLEAVRSSLGSLDSPPLATAAVVLAGAQALPAFQEYAASDAANDWGACGFVAAAIEYVGGSCEACTPIERDSSAFTELLALAVRLRKQR
jgi:hypothetical protein